jgi:hypothetical protein
MTSNFAKAQKGSHDFCVGFDCQQTEAQQIIKNDRVLPSGGKTRIDRVKNRKL